MKKQGDYANPCLGTEASMEGSYLCSYGFLWGKGILLWVHAIDQTLFIGHLKIRMTYDLCFSSNPE